MKGGRPNVEVGIEHDTTGPQDDILDFQHLIHHQTHLWSLSVMYQACAVIILVNISRLTTVSKISNAPQL